MIKFRTLTDDDPDLQYSPLLRAALVTMAYAQEHGAIPLTQTKAFKRVFVHWAVEQINWPNHSLHEMLRYQKVLNESDFAPLEVLRCLLIQLKLARHYKDQFRLTKRGVELAKSPAGLFAELTPYFVLRLDHSSYSRFDERPLGKWDVWLNVINWEADHGSTDARIYKAFYGDEDRVQNQAWREMSVFFFFVLRPLTWAGLLVEQRVKAEDGTTANHIFKTPLWRSVLKLDLDDQLRPHIIQ